MKLPTVSTVSIGNLLNDIMRSWRNPRTKRMTWGLNRLKDERKQVIFAAADRLRSHLLVS